MGWPSKFYCATSSLGVYYTSNFDGVNQPTWSTVNTGLASLGISKFALDPFTPALRQYCLANAVLYRRDNGGSWVSILDGPDGDALVGGGEYGGYIAYFYADRSIAGRLWAFYRGTRYSGGLTYGELYAFYSNDYGDTWANTALMESGWASERTPYYMVANGDNVWATWARGDGSHCSYSADKGGSWGSLVISPSSDGLAINPLQPTIAYHSDNSGSGHLQTIDTAGALTTLISTRGFNRPDGMWFSAITANHQRAVSTPEYKIYYTANGWATDASPGAITSQWPVAFAPYVGADEDQMIVGLFIDHAYSRDHIIGFLYGEADVTSTGMAGTNCGTSPFADSIPYNCGGVAFGGIATIEEVMPATEGPTPPPGGTITPPGGTPVTLDGNGNVQAVTMPGYLGDDRGEPLPGDRGAWLVDTVPHAELHASDIAAGVYIRHMPLPSIAGSVPMADGMKYVLTDVLTPTEHTAIGDGTPHHAEATTAVGSDPALVISAGQVVTLTLPPASTTQTAIAAVVLTAGNMVSLYNDGGTLKARLADCSLGLQADGYVLAGYGIGATATVYLSGFNTSLAGLTIGDMLYLSTAGAVIATAPTTGGYIVQPIGQAITATKAIYRREHTILLAT